MPNLFTDLGDDLQLTDESDDWGEDGAGTVTSQSLLSCRAVWFVILHAYFNSSVINLIILFLNEINWMNHINSPMYLNSVLTSSGGIFFIHSWNQIHWRSWVFLLQRWKNTKKWDTQGLYLPIKWWRHFDYPVSLQPQIPFLLRTCQIHNLVNNDWIK